MRRLNQPLPEIAGIKWPLTFVNGRVAVSRGEQHIRESILQIIGMNKGEHLMKPTLGSDINRRVFDTMDVAIMSRLDVEEAIEEWEPRVDLVGVRGSQSPTGEVEILIEYIVRQSQRRGEATLTVRRQ